MAWLETVAFVSHYTVLQLVRGPHLKVVWNCRGTFSMETQLFIHDSSLLASLNTDNTVENIEKNTIKKEERQLTIPGAVFFFYCGWV